MRSTDPAFLFYSTFVCVTVYFQYHQHLKVIRHICRWNMFLWIHLSAHTLNADFTWVYSSPLGLPRSFDKAISTASCGVLAVAGFCGNGNELMAYTKAVKLLTSRSTSALFLFFREKYALWFLCWRTAWLVIMPTQNYNDFTVPFPNSSMFESRFKTKLESDYIIFVKLRTCAVRRWAAGAPLLRSRLDVRASNVGSVVEKEAGNVTGFSICI